MSDWQPIGKVPTDGTEFQAWAKNDYAAADDKGFWVPTARFNADTNLIEILQNEEYFEYLSHITFSHWMPLPEAPKP